MEFRLIGVAYFVPEKSQPAEKLDLFSLALTRIYTRRLIVRNCRISNEEMLANISAIGFIFRNSGNWPLINPRYPFEQQLIIDYISKLKISRLVTRDCKFVVRNI